MSELPDPAFGHWFAGFTDGEGCFDISPTRNNGKIYYYCRFTIGVRADDRLILEEVQQRLGIGRVWSKTSPSVLGSPQTIFSVIKKTECLVLQDMFQLYPLRAKKAEDFKLWSQALDCSLLRRQWDGQKLSIMKALKEQMESNRKFDRKCLIILVITCETHSLIVIVTAPPILDFRRGRATHLANITGSANTLAVKMMAHEKDSMKDLPV